jgi:hypothetical protein
MAKDIEHDDLYKTYNPRSANSELPNVDEKFVTEDDVEVDDDSNFENEHLENEEDENLEEHQALTPEMITAMLEFPDEQLAQYGIDNPKQWKSYQRAFTKANQELKALKSKIAQQESEGNGNNKLAELERQIAELKTPNVQQEQLKRPVRPTLPQMPANFDYSRAGDQGTAEYAYMQEKMVYDQKKAIYDEQYEIYKETIDAQRTQQSEAQIKMTKKTIEQQQIKQEMVSKLAKQDLTPAEAAAAFEMALKPEFYDEKLIAMGYKMKMGKKVEQQVRKEKRTDKREKFFAPGFGGGKAQNQARSGEFSSTKDTSNLYKTTKQG